MNCWFARLIDPARFQTTGPIIPKHGNRGQRYRPAVPSNISVPTYALSKTHWSATAISSPSLKFSISTDSTVSTASTTFICLSTDSSIFTHSKVFTSSDSLTTISAGKLTQITSEQSTSESTSIALTENASPPIMTSELSAISPSIAAGIATTSETSTTSAASTQGVLPTVYTANPNIGPGGQIHNESKHFRVYGTIPVNVDRTHDLLEGEYDYLSGKPLRTGSQTSNICAPAREKANRSAAASIIEVKKLIGDSIRVVIGGSPSTGNYNQAWPCLAYLVNDPYIGEDLTKGQMKPWKWLWPSSKDEGKHVLGEGGLAMVEV
ncbi:hypothetical protein FOXB_05116 [Fusarium oxysporum f. sp. conglutinans Fo5176]|uniref:Uncharacterized protein n=2 Tax=Fusarium oxysporum f. sp. conglutinans TaxID=100902 RepID=F9FFD7_FUSOF|nr:hypothetical protein FOXB_05116 [Fusarium oxysporum f. sp. conglutinans Fo5176]